MDRWRDRWTEWFKHELDAEIMACMHGFVMVFLYLMEKFIAGSDMIGFLCALEMGILAYGAAWIQKLLFIRDRIYGKWEYRLRLLGWIFFPYGLTVLTGQVFGWFEGIPHGVAVGVVFYVVMAAYYILFAFLIERFYMGESRRLNELLRELKAEEKKRKTLLTGKEEAAE